MPSPLKSPVAIEMGPENGTPTACLGAEFEGGTLRLDARSQEKGEQGRGYR